MNASIEDGSNTKPISVSYLEVLDIKTKEVSKRPIPLPRNIYLKKNNKDFIPYSYTLSKQNETINEGF